MFQSAIDWYDGSRKPRDATNLDISRSPGPVPFDGHENEVMVKCFRPLEKMSPVMLEVSACQEQYA